MIAITETIARWLPGTGAQRSQADVKSLFIQRGPTDMVLLYAVLLLCGIGLVGVYSGSALTAYHYASDHDDMHYLWRQLQGMVLGFGALAVFSRVDYRIWGRNRFLVLGISAALLTLTIIPGISDTVNGSTRWVAFLGFRFQPSEVAKVAACIYFAGNIAAKQHTLGGHFEFVGNLVVGLGLAGLLMMQPDLGSTVLIGLIMFTLLYVGGSRWLHLGPLVVIGVAGFIAAIFMTRYGYRVERIAAWLNPWQHQSEAGYQLVASYTALASGGEVGTGFGRGRTWLGYIPEMYNDFIAAGIGEEFGLLGIGALLMLFLVVLWRGVSIADRARDRLGYLLAIGLTALILMQAGMNLAVVTGLVPTKGITLPFVSYGRSSVIIMLAAVGILLNIGQNNPDLVREAAEEARLRRIDQLRRQKHDRVTRHRREKVARHTGAHRALRG